MFQSVAGVAAACFLGVTAGPVGAQQGLTDMQRFRALEQKIWDNNKPALDAKENPVRGSYGCSSDPRHLIGLTVTADGKSIHSKENIVVVKKGFYYTLQLHTWATPNGGKVQIGSLPPKLLFQINQDLPAMLLPSSSISQAPDTIRDRYDRHQTESSPDIASIERAVDIACKPKSEEPSYPVIVQLLAPHTYHM